MSSVCNCEYVLLLCTLKSGWMVCLNITALHLRCSRASVQLSQGSDSFAEAPWLLAVRRARTLWGLELAAWTVLYLCSHRFHRGIDY